MDTKGDIKMQYIDIKDYHEREGISSSMLKKIMVSDAHLERMIDPNEPKPLPTKAMILGDAFHALLLQPDRFSENYDEVEDLYKVNVGGHQKGEPKTDSLGRPVFNYIHKTDGNLSIGVDDYYKLQAMKKAVYQCPEAMELLNKAKYTEFSFFYKDLKVRPDFITSDGWIVDLKTVGGMNDKPSAPDSFARDFCDLYYDIQMYMYTEVVKRELPNIKGFKFLCVDVKIPSGVQIYTFIPNESLWYELGGYRFRDALKRYRNYQKTAKHLTYPQADMGELPLSYNAEKQLLEYRDMEKSNV